MEESYPVQLQTLTAVVKLFLRKPETSQGLVQKVLNTATKDCDSPDVRDRAYIYWRLLSTDPGAAKAVILAHRPPISIPRTNVSSALLDELISEMPSLASVYHKPAGTFIGLGRIGADSMQKREDVPDDQFSAQKALQTVAAGQQAENLLDFDDSPSDQPSGLAATQISTAIPAAANLIAGTSANPLDDLVSIFGNLGTAQPMPNMMSPANAFGSPPPLQLQQQQNSFAGSGLGGVASPPPQITSPPPQQQQKEDDLLGLF